MTARRHARTRLSWLAGLARAGWNAANRLMERGDPFINWPEADASFSPLREYGSDLLEPLPPMPDGMWTWKPLDLPAAARAESAGPPRQRVAAAPVPGGGGERTLRAGPTVSDPEGATGVNAPGAEFQRIYDTGYDRRAAAALRERLAADEARAAVLADVDAAFDRIADQARWDGEYILSGYQPRWSTT